MKYFLIILIALLVIIIINNCNFYENKIESFSTNDPFMKARMDVNKLKKTVEETENKLNIINTNAEIKKNEISNCKNLLLPIENEKELLKIKIAEEYYKYQIMFEEENEAKKLADEARTNANNANIIYDEAKREVSTAYKNLQIAKNKAITTAENSVIAANKYINSEESLLNNNLNIIKTRNEEYNKIQDKIKELKIDEETKKNKIVNAELDYTERLLNLENQIIKKNNLERPVRDAQILLENQKNIRFKAMDECDYWTNEYSRRTAPVTTTPTNEQRRQQQIIEAEDKKARGWGYSSWADYLKYKQIVTDIITTERMLEEEERQRVVVEEQQKIAAEERAVAKARARIAVEAGFFTWEDYQDNIRKQEENRKARVAEETRIAWVAEENRIAAEAAKAAEEAAKAAEEAAAQRAAQRAAQIVAEAAAEKAQNEANAAAAAAAAAQREAEYAAKTREAQAAGFNTWEQYQEHIRRQQTMRDDINSGETIGKLYSLGRPDTDVTAVDFANKNYRRYPVRNFPLFSSTWNWLLIIEFKSNNYNDGLKDLIGNNTRPIGWSVTINNAKIQMKIRNKTYVFEELGNLINNNKYRIYVRFKTLVIARNNTRNIYTLKLSNLTTGTETYQSIEADTIWNDDGYISFGGMWWNCDVFASFCQYPRQTFNGIISFVGLRS
jgi:hypothetical protein